MEQKGFFQTKAGRLTIAFLVIAVACVLIVTGLQSDGNRLCTVGFLMIVAILMQGIPFSSLKKRAINSFCVSPRYRLRYLRLSFL